MGITEENINFQPGSFVISVIINYSCYHDFIWNVMVTIRIIYRLNFCSTIAFLLNTYCPSVSI